MIKKSCFKIQIHYFWILKIFFLVWSKQRWKNYWRWIYQSWFVYSRIIWIWRIRWLIFFFLDFTNFFFEKNNIYLYFAVLYNGFYSEAILRAQLLNIVSRFCDLRKSLCSIIIICQLTEIIKIFWCCLYVYYYSFFIFFTIHLW